MYISIYIYIYIYIYPNDALTLAIKSLIIQMQTDRLTTNIFASQFFCKNLCHLFSILHFCHPIYNFLCEWGQKKIFYILVLVRYCGNRIVSKYHYAIVMT